MSGDLKYPAEQIRTLAERVVYDLRDLVERWEIAGSLRRKKPMVGDVEIVALPRHAPTLLARLDTWVATGKAFKARYSDGSNRWGEKYRGLSFSGYPVKVEIFLADAVNWGWILAMRTGSADANQFMMSQCIRFRAPFRSEGGYWVADGRRIAVPDEASLFRLWGSKVIKPEDRTLEVYQGVFARPQWAKEWTWVDAQEATEQTSMF